MSVGIKQKMRSRWEDERTLVNLWCRSLASLLNKFHAERLKSGLALMQAASVHWIGAMLHSFSSMRFCA
jgi:hypothetical protein